MSTARPGRPRHTTHADIRAVAMKLFSERGYEQTSLNQIAQAVGISRTTLFAYFPAKRDLMWDEFDERTERMKKSLHNTVHLHPVQRIVDALLAIAHYEPAEHDEMMQRWQIMQGSEELRAAAARRTDQLCDEIVRMVHAGASTHLFVGVSETTLADVTTALKAVGDRCAVEWGTSATPEESLQSFSAKRLRPIALALHAVFE